MFLLYCTKPCGKGKKKANSRNEMFEAVDGIHYSSDKKSLQSLSPKTFTFDRHYALESLVGLSLS